MTLAFVFEAHSSLEIRWWHVSMQLLVMVDPSPSEREVAAAAATAARPAAGPHAGQPYSVGRSRPGAGLLLQLQPPAAPQQQAHPPSNTTGPQTTHKQLSLFSVILLLVGVSVPCRKVAKRSAHPKKEPHRQAQEKPPESHRGSHRHPPLLPPKRAQPSLRALCPMPRKDVCLFVGQRSTGGHAEAPGSQEQPARGASGETTTSSWR